MGLRKVLARRQTGEVIGLYQAPLFFSVSGNFVIDIPDGIPFNTLPTDPSGVYTAKIQGLISLNPGLTNGFAADVTELSSQIDQTLSNGYIVNDAGISLAPGGGIITNLFVPATSFDTIYLHYYGFFLTRFVDPNNLNSPASILYNYDPAQQEFVEFDPTSIQVNITDSTGSETLYTPTPDVQFPANFGAFRIQFINLGSEVQRLSEYILLYNTVV